MKAIQFSPFKILFLTTLLMLLGQTAYLQNVGVGTGSPQSKLHVSGSFLASSSYKGTSAAVLPENQLNMINGQTINFFNDSIARFYDPGGPTGNYLPNMATYARCSTWVGNFNDAYLEITIESLQLGTGDSLKISEGFTNDIFYRIGNTTFNTPVIIHSSSPQVTFTFQSNADASVGAGFSVKTRVMYPDVNSDVNQFASGYGITFRASDQTIRMGKIDQSVRGEKSVAIGAGAVATGNESFSAGTTSRARGNYAVAIGSSTTAEGSSAVAIGTSSWARGNSSFAMGASSNADGASSMALSGGTASGTFSVAMGSLTDAVGRNSTAIGIGTRTISRGSIAVGSYNANLISEDAENWVNTDPLFIVGNGTGTSDRSNALLIRKDGKIGIGTNLPTSDLHIRQSSSGGLVLENPSDGNSWRLYSASGDNNLTFYNNSNVEIADIDDVTGTFSAISDARLKKNIEPLQNILPLLMQLVPTTYLFNWQQADEEKQIGMIAQEAHKLFPELVSYDKEKDLYKINYAGFSTVAIKAIQEQQQKIESLEKRLAAIEAKLNP